MVGKTGCVGSNSPHSKKWLFGIILALFMLLGFDVYIVTINNSSVKLTSESAQTRIAPLRNISRSRTSWELSPEPKNLIYYGTDKGLSVLFNNEEMIQKYSDGGNMSRLKRFPRCICIGTPKAGTQALVFFMNMHPQVVSYLKEGLLFQKPDYQKYFEKYLNKMPYSTTEQITFEKSPEYVSWKKHEVPTRIYKYDSNIKLLVTVKNPIDKALSYYRHWQKRYPQPFGVQALYKGEVRANYKPLEQSVYWNLLRPWFKVFRREQIHVVDGDALVQSPATELQKIEEFLQIKPFFQEEHFYFNTTKQFFCYGNGSISECLHPIKGHQYKPLDPKVRHKLVDFFKPHNEKFFTMIGQRFNWTT